jgi:hypothetical protein
VQPGVVEHMRHEFQRLEDFFKRNVADYAIDPNWKSALV